MKKETSTEETIPLSELKALHDNLKTIRIQEEDYYKAIAAFHVAVAEIGLLIEKHRKKGTTA